MARSALVVLVPEAEALVERLRLANDPMAGRGVPAHVTVLHPFRATLDDEAHDAIGALCAATAPWDAAFAGVERFPQGVVYLAPQPAERFVELTRRLAAAFPDCPPYGGAFAEPIPHLTVGSHLDNAAADELAARLHGFAPFTAAVRHLTRLVEDDAGQWTVERSWPLTGR